MSTPLNWPEGPILLKNVHGPWTALPPSMAEGGRDGLVPTAIALRDGAIAEPRGDETVLDLAGAVALPAFVDCHTHLDKGHIWHRQPNPDGTFQGALEAVRGDRGANWTGADVATRMGFGLEAAYARGTVAVRTHLDSGDHRTESSWNAFAEAREAWAGRITLQAACLTILDEVESDAYCAMADLVARHRGVLGAVTYPMPDLPRRLDTFFRLAAERGLDTDFHADESLDPASDTLRLIAEAKIRNGFEGRVLCGHCCTLSVMAEAAADRTMDAVAEAGLDIVSLPMCNMYLQDRHAGRTPRYRGVTLVHELKARGVNVSFASDNTRDPFYAYGDLDMAEVMREATRIAHLDHPVADWPASFARNPARAMGLSAEMNIGSLTPGAPADLVIFPGARSWTELNARPHTDRLVIRGGRPLTATPPAYDRLDPLFETPRPLSETA